MNEQKERPGKIVEVRRWEVSCELCRLTFTEIPTYQEASIQLTTHLDEAHAGWDVGEAAEDGAGERRKV